MKSLINETAITKTMAVFLALIFIIAFVMAQVPEIFYDALVYHLGVPNYYLQEHCIAYLPNLHSQFPLTIQMIYLLGLVLQGEIATKLTHVFFMGMVALSMISLGTRLGRRSSGIIAALVFCSIPMVQMNVWTSGIDVATCLFGFLSIYCLVSADRISARDPWLLVSAVFSGLAFASKYTAILIPGAAIVFLLANVIFSPSQRQERLKAVLVYGLLVLVVMLPWFIKNLLQTGNPIYPFLNQTWGHLPIKPWRLDLLVKGNNGFTPHSFREAMTIFWTLSVDERSSMGFLGPLILGCSFFWVSRLRVSKYDGMATILFCASIGLIVGLFITRYTRFLLPVMSLIAFIVGWGLDRTFQDKRQWLRSSALVLFSAFYFLQMSWAVLKIQRAFEPGDILMGRISEYDYLVRDQFRMKPNSSYPMFRYLKSHFLPGQKVLFVGEEKAYPVGVPHMYSGVFDEGPLVTL